MEAYVSLENQMLFTAMLDYLFFGQIALQFFMSNIGQLGITAEITN